MLHESEASRRMKGRKDKWVLKIIYCSSIQLGRKKTSKCQGHIENLRKKKQERMNCLPNLLCMQELMNLGLPTSWCQLQFFFSQLWSGFGPVWTSRFSTPYLESKSPEIGSGEGTLTTRWR